VESVPPLHGGDIEALCPMEAEFATPHWTFGNSMYGFLSGRRARLHLHPAGVSYLAWLKRRRPSWSRYPHPYQEIRELRAGPGFVALLAGSPTIALELARIDLSNHELEVLAQSITQLPALAYLSVPRSISFPSSNGRTAHAFFYPPKTMTCRRRPALAARHRHRPRRPTGMDGNTLKLATQYWTSRGIGVLDVNYGGSSGLWPRIPRCLARAMGHRRRGRLHRRRALLVAAQGSTPSA
jgi:dipeptidyl aminopeptidase/acylaminoacyl peptidase